MLGRRARESPSACPGHGGDGAVRWRRGAGHGAGSGRWSAAAARLPVHPPAAETTGAMVFVLPLFLIFGDLTLTSFDLGKAELAIAILAAAGVIESILFFHLIRDTGGVLVSFGSFVSLFAGVAWGIILFSESYGATVWLAVAVLAVALFLAAADRSHKVEGN